MSFIAPKIRFKYDHRNDFPDWEEITIGEVGRFYYGKSAPKFSLSEDAPTPCVRYGELYSTYNVVVEEIKSKTNIDPKKLKFSQGGEILVPRVGEDPLDFAKCCCLLPQKGVAIGEMISVFNTKENPLFYTYYFKTLSRQFARLVEGASVSNLYFRYLEPISIFKPARDEQTKIADFMTAVDGRIQQLTQKKALLEDYKKGVMQQLFTQAIRFKDKVNGGAREGALGCDHGNDFPDWEEKKLGDVGSTYSGLSGKSGEDFGTGKPYVTYKQIFDRTNIDLRKCARVAIKPNENQNRVRKGDVLFTTSSETRLEVGYTSVVMEDVEELYLNSFCFGFRMIGDNELLPEFARYLFHSSDVRRAIAVLGQGSTRYNISKNQLMKQKLQFPSVPEQTKIADFLAAIDRKIESVTTQITETQTFKRGLLQQMFV